MNEFSISKFAMFSHKGVAREHNDDKVFASRELGLWLLSDGVGGLAQGEQASQFVIEEMMKSMTQGKNLPTSVHSAHSVIKAYNRHETEDRGATVVALFSKDSDEYELAWVGDTRAYLWNSDEQKLTQLTEDHTLVQKLVNAGLLTEEEAKTHPKRHVITQCLGIEDKHQLDIGHIKREWGYKESIVIASDGLYEELTEQEIILGLQLNRDNQAKVEWLVDKACKNGGKDNISIIVIDSPITAPQPKQHVLVDKLQSFVQIFKKG